MTTPGLMRGLPVAIPADEALQIAQRLASQQPLGRGYLGVNVHGVELTERQQQAAAERRGLLVLGVVHGGGAERGGLVVGDILLRFDGRPVVRPDALQDALAGLAPGATARVTALRGLTLEELTVTIAERPAA
jgi:S1-C subfamily serine protease